jgi:exodeoxyribonuclease VII large subunit
VARGAQRTAELQVRLRQGVLTAVGVRRRYLAACGKLLTSLSYQGVLKRGFALLRDTEGNSVRSVRQVAPGERLDIELADGHVAARAGESVEKQSGETASQEPAQPRTRRAEAGRAKSRAPDDQGSLF